MREKILIVDDDKLIRWSLSEALRSWNYIPIEADNLSSAIKAFEDENPVVTLLDINFPDGSGHDVLRQIKDQQKEAIVIMITANVQIDDTLAALRAGAYDFISKPINLEQLQISIRNGIEALHLRRVVNEVRNSQAEQFSFSQIVGESDAIKETIALAKKVASSEVSSVLLQGESGTGKDLIAKAIHYSSPYARQPFVAINCAAIPGNLLESELFGYEKGAFTDAKKRKEGLFEQANGGTLFLDEIGEIELGLQAKLLRVLEEGMLRRIGGLKDFPLNVRVIAASNRDLKSECDADRFRVDLYYRLSVIQIDIPPLRDRGEDIILLANNFIKVFDSPRKLKTQRKLSAEAAKVFLNHNWMGNVRELKNAVERALILEDGAEITTKYLPRDLIANENNNLDHSNESQFLKDVNFYLPPEGIPLEVVEKGLIQQALKRTNGNVTRAGKLLHLSRDRMRYRLKKVKDQKDNNINGEKKKKKKEKKEI